MSEEAKGIEYRAAKVVVENRSPDDAKLVAAIVALVADERSAMREAAAQAAANEVMHYQNSDDPDERHYDSLEDSVAAAVRALDQNARPTAQDREREIRLAHINGEIMALDLAINCPYLIHTQRDKMVALRDKFESAASSQKEGK